MRAPIAIAVAVSLCLLASRLDAQMLHDVPLRINMGGAETVDSFGRTWLGDGPGSGDPLGIRPDDAGGAHQLLRIGLLPCPECRGAGDVNAIIDALEVISGPDCDHLGLNFNCAYDAAADRVNGTWSQLPGVEGYRLLKNGTPLGGDLP